MILKKTAMAGTLESSDVMITVAPNGGRGIQIELQSDVQAQFGDAIRETVMAVLKEMEVTDAAVSLVDKGALDCAIRARMRCALCRGAEEKYDWTREER